MTPCVAILLGGRSVRMGEPKHLIQVGNMHTLMDVVVNFASTLTESIVTVGGRYGALPHVLDRRHDAGPLAGVEALLHSRICQRYIVIGCDMPYLNNQSMQRLIYSTRSAAFIREDRMYGMPCVIDSACAKLCTSCLDEGMRSIKDFLRRIDCQLFPATSELATSFSSLNTPSDVHDFTLKNGCT